MNDIVFPVKILNGVSVDSTIPMEGTINQSLDMKLINGLVMIIRPEY